MKTVLLICSDEEYNNNIEAQLSMQFHSDVILHIITDEENLKKVASQPNEVSTILIEPKFLQVLGTSIKAKEAFILDDNTSDLPEGHISKYAGIQAVLRVISHKLLKHEGEVIDRDARIIDVVSVCGGCGKTIASLGLAKRLSLMGRKVLYVNTQALQDYLPYIDGEKKVLSDALVRQMSYITESTTDMMLSEIGHVGFDYVPQMEQITTDMKVLESAYHEIVENISKKYVYDYIVVEHGNSLSSEMLKWLSHSERMVIITKQDEISIRRTDRFIGQLKGLKGQCTILCGRYDNTKPNYVNKSLASSKYPICEYVPELSELSLEKLIDDGIFTQCAEAML